jgi:hypothetical protein
MSLRRIGLIFSKKFDAFAKIDGGGPGRSATDDKRLTVGEWLQGYRGVDQHGFVALQGIASEDEAGDVFRKMDGNGGGVVLLDEWCHFLKNCEVAAGTALGALLAEAKAAAEGAGGGGGPGGAPFALTLPREGVAKSPPLLSSGRKVGAAAAPVSSPAAAASSLAGGENPFEVVSRLRPDLLSAAAHMAPEERAQLAAALSAAVLRAAASTGAPAAAPAAASPPGQASRGRGFFGGGRRAEAEAEALAMKLAEDNRQQREKEVRTSLSSLKPFVLQAEARFRSPVSRPLLRAFVRSWRRPRRARRASMS